MDLAVAAATAAALAAVREVPEAATAAEARGLPVAAGWAAREVPEAAARGPQAAGCITEVAGVAGIVTRTALRPRPAGGDAWDADAFPRSSASSLW